MGYALTDGSVGVQFNDDATMVMTPNKRYVVTELQTRSHG
jgi:hypothetical protein